MDQNDKNRNNKNNDRRKGVLSLLVWALVLTIGFNYLLSTMDTKKLAESSCEIRYDEFVELVKDGKVSEVEITDKVLNITPADGVTYTDEDGQAHFVLFDDDATLEAKLAQLSGCGVQTVFALFPDAAWLLSPS